MPGGEKLKDRFRVACRVPNCGWKSDALSRNPKNASKEGGKHLAAEHPELLEVQPVKVRVTTEIVE